MNLFLIEIIAIIIVFINGGLTTYHLSQDNRNLTKALFIIWTVGTALFGTFILLFVVVSGILQLVYRKIKINFIK